MTFSINIADANFTSYVAEVLPYASLASLFLLLGGDETKSSLNYVGTKQVATVVATPIYAENYCTLSGVNGFEAPMAISGSPFTNIIVTQQATGNVGYCGNWLQSGGAAAQANALNRSNNNVAQAVDSNNRINTPMGALGFQFVAGSHDGATAKIYLGDRGVLTSASSAYVGGFTNKAKFRVGATGFGSGTFAAAAVLRFDSVLSEDQILRIYGYLKRLLSSRGIAVN